MSYSAEQVLGAFTDAPETLHVEPIFEDEGGNVCRAFYVLNGQKKRRILIRITAEYCEDVLHSKESFERSVSEIREMLSKVRKSLHNQNDKLVREPDFVLSRL